MNCNQIQNNNVKHIWSICAFDQIHCAFDQTCCASGCCTSGQLHKP